MKQERPLVFTTKPATRSPQLTSADSIIKVLRYFRNIAPSSPEPWYVLGVSMALAFFLSGDLRTEEEGSYVYPLRCTLLYTRVVRRIL